MTGWIEDDLLRFEGLNDTDLRTLNNRLPDLKNLLAVAKAHQAQLSRVINDLEPIVEKLINKQMELGK